MTLLPCGKCWNVRYCEAFSEWYCAKYHTFLVHSISPHKCRQCDVIGIDGDTKLMKVLWEMIIEED
jgi:hypothetical protein